MPPDYNQDAKKIISDFWLSITRSGRSRQEPPSSEQQMRNL